MGKEFKIHNQKVISTALKTMKQARHAEECWPESNTLYSSKYKEGSIFGIDLSSGLYCTLYIELSEENANAGEDADFGDYEDRWLIVSLDDDEYADEYEKLKMFCTIEKVHN